MIALVVFLGTLIAIGVWQRSLNRTLGSVGARKAVFNRAGYVYFRGAWLVSILLSVFLQATTNNNGSGTIQDAVSHDHKLMLYYGLRAVVGVVLDLLRLPAQEDLRGGRRAAPGRRVALLGTPVLTGAVPGGGRARVGSSLIRILTARPR